MSGRYLGGEGRITGHLGGGCWKDLGHRELTLKEGHRWQQWLAENVENVIYDHVEDPKWITDWWRKGYRQIMQSNCVHKDDSGREHALGRMQTRNLTRVHAFRPSFKPISPYTPPQHSSLPFQHKSLAQTIAIVPLEISSLCMIPK